MADNNNIPKHWRIVSIKDIAKKEKYSIVDGPFGTQMKVHEFVSTGVPLIEMQNIDKDKFVPIFRRFVTNEKFEEIKRSAVKSGDIIISKTGSLGYVAIVPEQVEKAIITSRLAKLSIDWNLVEKKYLLNYLLFLREKGYWQKIAKGTTMKILNIGQLAETEIPLPLISEQQAIVWKIEELLSDLENGKQQLQKAQQQLKIYRQSLLKWAFKGRFGYAQRPSNGVKDGELPKGWKWVKNKELLKYVTSGSRDWKKYYSTKGSRFVRTQDINSNKLNIANSAFVDLPEKVEGKRSLIEEGDILMTITGANVGKVAVIDFPVIDAYVSQSVALLKYNDKRITKFLWYYFQAQGFGKSFIEKFVYGVGRPVLSLENMRDVDVLICPHEEQQRIIEELESKLTVCDKIEETISQSLHQAETLKQSILKKAFEGKLVTV